MFPFFWTFLYFFISQNLRTMVVTTDRTVYGILTFREAAPGSLWPLRFTRTTKKESFLCLKVQRSLTQIVQTYSDNHIYFVFQVFLRICDSHSSISFSFSPLSPTLSPAPISSRRSSIRPNWTATSHITTATETSLITSINHQTVRYRTSKTWLTPSLPSTFERSKMDWSLMVNDMERSLGLFRFSDFLVPKDTSRWSMISSIFFTTTVLTSIGYGNLIPISISGKLFCVGYAIFGQVSAVYCEAEKGFPEFHWHWWP